MYTHVQDIPHRDRRGFAPDAISLIICQQEGISIYICTHTYIYTYVFMYNPGQSSPGN